MSKKEPSPGYKRKELFSKIFNKKKINSFLYAWFGDITSFPKSLLLKINDYLKPQNRPLKKKWYYFYAYYIVVIQIIFDLIQIADLININFYLESVATVSDTIYYDFISAFIRLLFFAMLVSIYFRIKCRRYLINSDLRAFGVIKFYHMYYYLLILPLYIANLITYDIAGYEYRHLVNLYIERICMIILFFLFWSLPNLIYFRRRLNMLKEIKKPLQ